MTPDGTFMSTLSFGGVGDDAVSGIAGTRADGAFIVGLLGTDLGPPACEDYPVGGSAFLRRL